MQHTLEFFNFSLLFTSVLMYFILPSLIFRSLVQNPLFLKVIFPELLISEFKLLVDIDAVVDLLVQDVNIGEQIVVLLFSLDKRVLDLNDIGQSSGFFDSIKGLINNLHISLITINEFDFLFVVNDVFGQPLSQHGCSVVLYRIYLSCFYSASSIKFGILQIFVKLSESTVVVCFVLLVLHFEAEH